MAKLECHDKCKPSYIWNSIAFALVVAFFITLRVLTLIGKPTIRGFYCNDESILHPRSDHESFPTEPLVVYIILLPLATIIFGSLLTTFVFKSTSTARHHNGSVKSPPSRLSQRLLSSIIPPAVHYVWYIMGLGMLVTIVDVLKLYTGELRPQFIHTCNPDWQALNCTSTDAVVPAYISNYKYRGDEGHVREMRLSFPSGHAAYTMYAALFTTLYISKIPLNTPRSPMQLLFMGVVLLSSILISISRLVDNRHHPHDVIFGFIIGILFAVVVVFYNLRYFTRKTETTNSSSNEHTKEISHEKEQDQASEPTDSITPMMMSEP